MRDLIKRFLKWRGYELVRTDRFGVRALVDVAALYETTSVEVIFDVGANIGQMTVDFAKAFPAAAIHSFEPFDVAYKALCERARPFSGVKTVPRALGEKRGRQALYLNEFAPTNSLLPNDMHADRYQPQGGASPVGSKQIEVDTIDAYCAENGVDFIDLLKMDTQGFELRVLRGGKNTLRAGKVAAIYTEMLFVPLYSGQAYFHEIYKVLVQLGYKLVQLYECNYGQEKHLKWCDALFIHPEVLRRRMGVGQSDQ